MTALSSNVVSSAIFGVRNYEKGNDGHIVRYAVAAGQAKKVADYVTKLDNVVGKTTKMATDVLSAASKESIFLEGCGKVAHFSSTHINPLIVASALVDVVTSENKMDTAITSTTSLGVMFTAEKLMKAHLKDVSKLGCLKGVVNAVDKLAKTTKYGKFIAPLLEGITFVIGSCTAYSVGNKLGNMIIGKGDEKISKPTK